MSTSTKNSPFKWWQAIPAGVKIGAGLLAAHGVSQGVGAIKKKNQANREEIRKANEELRTQKKSYLDFDITNPYMGLTNAYKGMENVMEDLTVDQKAAQFQAEQTAQQRADIMSNLRGTAGASGVAGLAQSLAQQGQVQAQQMSASIAQQEAMNQRMKTQEASRIQQLQRGAEMQIQGQEAYGELMRQQREMGRQETLLAGAYARAGAAYEAKQRFTEGIMGGISNIVGAGLQGLTGATFNFGETS